MKVSDIVDSLNFGDLITVEWLDASEAAGPLEHAVGTLRNTPEDVENAAERETVGWLTQENKELLCIQHDRTIESPQYASGTASGLVLLKSCILEIRALPLQNTSRWHLISRNDITRNAESALQNAKRKTQPAKSRKEGKNHGDIATRHPRTTMSAKNDL